MPDDLPAGPLALAGLGIGLISTIAFFRVSLLPSIGDALSLSAAELGVLTMVFGIGRLLTDVPAGRLAGRIRPGLSFGVAGGLMAVASFGLAAARIGGEAYAAAFVLGVGSSISNTTGMTVFSTSVPRARRGTSMAVFSACVLCGQALGPAIGGAFTTIGSWRTAEAAAGVLGLGTATVLLLAPAGRRRIPRPPEQPVAAGDRGVALAERIVLYGVAFALFFTLGAMPQTLVPIIGSDVFGLGAATIGLALGLGGICRFAGSIAGGVVSDRVSRKAALVPGLVLLAVGVGLLALDAGLWVWLLAIVLMSVSSFGVSVAATILADRSRLAAVGRRFGSFRFVGDLGLIAGPALAGGLFAHVGRHAAVLTVAALPAGLALATALVVTEVRPTAPTAFEAEA